MRERRRCNIRSAPNPLSRAGLAVRAEEPPAICILLATYLMMGGVSIGPRGSDRMVVVWTSCGRQIRTYAPGNPTIIVLFL